MPISLKSLIAGGSETIRSTRVCSLRSRGVEVNLNQREYWLARKVALCSFLSTVFWGGEQIGKVIRWTSARWSQRSVDDHRFVGAPVILTLT